jgi:hypothetical protein
MLISILNYGIELLNKEVNDEVKRFL